MFHHGLVWFRRDLRLFDHTALIRAYESCRQLSLIFIFDDNILDTLSPDDHRLNFIWQSLNEIREELGRNADSMSVVKGRPEVILPEILADNPIDSVFFNEDYEPDARQRDRKISGLCDSLNVKTNSYRDQVIFGPDDIVKDDGSVYRVFTPYKNKWLSALEMSGVFPEKKIPDLRAKLKPLFLKKEFVCRNPEVRNPTDPVFTGGENAAMKQWKKFIRHRLAHYESGRNIPSSDLTSRLSPHLRFGTVSVRRMAHDLIDFPPSVRLPFLNELIWREFFMMILHHHPHVTDSCFRPNFNGLRWNEEPEWFDRWRSGRTGFPMVDAGMRQLNQIGWMHNRVRMITASFLVKHLHINWLQGENYFAEKLMDFELSSNNGNWQWAAGTGADAAPYFRIFHPVGQGKKFDPDAAYIKEWIPELRSVPQRQIHDRILYKKLYRDQKALHPDYVPPLIDPDEERLACLEMYNRARTGNRTL